MRQNLPVIPLESAILVSLASLATLAQAPTPVTTVAETWERGYSGESATGEQVVAFWKFSAGQETVDNSGHGQLHLTLDLALNDVPGMWEARVRELASGLESASYFRVSAAAR